MVDLQHIETSTVQKIIEYMTYHVTVPPREIISPLIHCRMKELVDEFDFALIDTDHETIFNLMLVGRRLYGFFSRYFLTRDCFVRLPTTWIFNRWFC